MSSSTSLRLRSTSCRHSPARSASAADASSSVVPTSAASTVLSVASVNSPCDWSASPLSVPRTTSVVSSSWASAAFDSSIRTSPSVSSAVPPATCDSGSGVDMSSPSQVSPFTCLAPVKSSLSCAVVSAIDARVPPADELSTPSSGSVSSKTAERSPSPYAATSSPLYGSRGSTSTILCSSSDWFVSDSSSSPPTSPSSWSSSSSVSSMTVGSACSGCSAFSSSWSSGCE
mmetsp:Transcript_20765/g.53951  ORF Transcript_20765/g.53951 Transcript_20765/m.53951 type:complete len:230 (+) Transcript_20765:1254-1943(+)